jgi:hypothetical protein
MTVRTSAKVAGFTFLFYIVAGIASMATRGPAAGVLTLLTSFCALVLGVTLYAITREQDRDLALIAMLCRVIEAVPGHGGSAIFFAVGSTIFAWLLLQGRMVPVWLARLGVAASAGLVVLLFLQRAGISTGASNWSSSLTWVIWFPLLVFELTFAVWLIVKGVSAPRGALAPR